MSSTVNPSQPFNPHTSVTNQPEEAAVEITPASESPYKGSAPDSTPSNPDGTEAVLKPPVPEAAGGASAWWSVPEGLKLPDVGEATFGPPLPIPETVHGPDERVQITNTSAYPWRVHASLLIIAADGTAYVGTGWFIGPHTLATAGHCVYIKNSPVHARNGWVQSIQVMPGRNGSDLPFGAVTSTEFYSVLGWTQNGDPSYDYGAIVLPTDLGNQTGWFGFGVYSDEDLDSATLNIAGYPSDKDDGTQWYHSNRVASVNSRKLYYNIDTVGGQSGSAVYRIIDGSHYGAAIHAYGGAITNSGTRITNPVYNNLLAWKA